MKAKTWLLSGVLAASMAGAVGSASAQTYVYSVDLVPSPKGQSVAVTLGDRDAEEVTATVQAYNAAGVLGGDEKVVTVPGNGFVRLNNADLALGHETGSRKVVIRADGELDVSTMRIIWSDKAVALPVQKRVVVAETWGRMALGWQAGGAVFYWSAAVNQPSRELAKQRARVACPVRSGCTLGGFVTYRSECSAVAVGRDSNTARARRFLAYTVGGPRALAEAAVWKQCYIIAHNEGYGDTPGWLNGGCVVIPQLTSCNTPGGQPAVSAGTFRYEDLLTLPPYTGESRMYRGASVIFPDP